MQASKQQETLIVRPGSVYLLLTIIFFVFAAAVFLAMMFIERTGWEDGLALLVLATLALCALPALPGVIYLIIWKTNKVVFDADGVVVTRTFRSTRRYLWDSISAKVEQQHGLQYNVILSAKGKQVAKVSQSWDGYGQLLDLLIARGLLKENALTKRGRTWAAWSHIKLKDLVRRNKSRK